MYRPENNKESVIKEVKDNLTQLLGSYNLELDRQEQIFLVPLLVTSVSVFLAQYHNTPFGYNLFLSFVLGIVILIVFHTVVSPKAKKYEMADLLDDDPQECARYFFYKRTKPINLLPLKDSVKFIGPIFDCITNGNVEYENKASFMNTLSKEVLSALLRESILEKYSK